MGKIFKALKKAEQENDAKPKQRLAANVVQPERKTAGPPAKAEPVERPDDQHAVPDRANRDMAPVGNPADMKPAVRLDQRSKNDPSASSQEPAELTIERQATHRLEKNSIHDNRHSAMEPPDRPVESRPVPKTDTSQATDAVKVALVKQEAAQPPPPIQHFANDPADTDKKGWSSGVRDTEPKKDIKVSYSRTKVQMNDPEKLKNNRVLSIFEDFETTNQFKILRTQVLRKLKAIGGNSILVTSANPYEGKTFTSINLGVSIAKEFDRTVLIIDADIRRPTKQHTDFSTKFFSLKVDKGLTDYLEGDVDIEDVLINPGIDKLTLIPGGTPVDNSPELLNSARMEEMMLEIKSRYPSDRLVIVDGPAILHFPDAMILYRYVDGVLPVVESERTSTEDLKKMMNHLKDVNILGVVLNKKRG